MTFHDELSVKLYVKMGINSQISLSRTTLSVSVESIQNSQFSMSGGLIRSQHGVPMRGYISRKCMRLPESVDLNDSLI